MTSVYNLASGYVDRFSTYASREEVRVTLWEEHGVYHVRSHNFDTHTRLVWKTFSALNDARAEFRAQKKAIQAGDLR